MDINSYDSRISDLIRTMLKQKETLENGVIDTTSQILKAAEELGDYSLIGFAHFHMADALYAFEDDYHLFREHLGKAISYLQMSGDLPMLARAYNYVGVDAMNNGSFDVGYFYFMNALLTCEDLDNDYLKSMVSNNIGQVYARVGSHAKALEYVREGNRLQALCSKDDMYYYQNLVNGYFSEGVLCVALGDYEGALRINRKIEELDKESGILSITSVVIPVSFLRIQIAILAGDEEEYEKQSHEVVDVVKKAHRLYDFITDIDDLCRFLLKHDRPEPVKQILDCVTDAVDTTGVIQMMRIISSLKIAYYDKVGDHKEMLALLKNQHELSEEQQKEQYKLYLYSIDLINTMDELRKERVHMQEENQNLQAQAMTDGLTGIPNRIALDKELDRIYDRLVKEKRFFGISMLDIDKFKEYNDNYGHQAGDDCLRRVASVMAEISKRSDVWCGRFGGDEFVMIFEGMDDNQVLEVAYELEEKVRELNIINSASGTDGMVSVSQGICNAIPTDETSPDEFMAEADNALYAVKKNLKTRRKHQSARLVHLPTR